MRLASIGVDPETKQANLILMFSCTGKLEHLEQQSNTKALYSLNFVIQLVDLVRSGFVIKEN